MVFSVTDLLLLHATPLSLGNTTITCHHPRAICALQQRQSPLQPLSKALCGPEPNFSISYVCIAARGWQLQASNSGPPARGRDSAGHGSVATLNLLERNLLFQLPFRCLVS
ncbi:hypothetical protein BD413DRAFT_527724 [Trametes elegans]|nr:hypothetical protein BD413DRAFT_527724 [Trametes elegans]